MATENAHNHAKSGPFDTFPLTDDVLVCTLEFLPLAQLRTTAGVSRKFRAAAWRSGLYIHRRITDWTYSYVTDRTDEDPNVLDLKIMVWNELVDHALEKNLRVALTIQWESYGDVILKEGTQRFSLLGTLLDSVTRSLPILVALSIHIGGFAYPSLSKALNEPAPCLRSLYLHSPRDEKPLGPITASCGLFSGKAAQLRELGLDHRSLAPEPLPVFSNVIRFSTQDCDLGPRVPLARLFPKLAHLRIVSDDPEESHVPPPQVDISGATLRSFVFHNTTWKGAPDIERSLDIPAPDVFHYVVDEGERNGWGSLSLGWRDSRCGQLALYLPDRRSPTNVRFMSQGESWRRSFIAKTTCGATEVYKVPNIAAQLGYLRMNQWFLFRLLVGSTHFVALRRLRVDISLPVLGDCASVGILGGYVELEELEDEEEYPVLVRCPVLETVAITWRCRAPDKYAALDRLELYALGRGLGASAKPVLELADIEHGRPLTLSDKPPKNGADVDVMDVFSVVRHVPCARGVITDQFDGEDWNDNAALDADKYLMQSLAW